MLKIDHIVIGVQDLSRAMADYTALGFNVRYGGRHASEATHNALIGFADGTYLELMAPTGDEATDAGPDYRLVLDVGEGIRGICLLTSDLNALVSEIRERDGDIDNIVRGGRTRPDGVALEWLTAMQPAMETFPFFIEDVTPRDLRVSMETEQVTHANGALGIETVSLPYGTAMHSNFEDMLGIDADCDSFGCRFTLEGATLELSRRKSDPALTIRVPKLVKSLVDEEINSHGVYFWLAIGK